MSLSREYLLISPCRNEAEFMKSTLDSVVAQSETPARWIIVDDGSTDETAAILQCIDPPNSAQVTPLIHRPLQASSFPTPDVVAGCCKT